MKNNFKTSQPPEPWGILPGELSAWVERIAGYEPPAVSALTWEEYVTAKADEINGLRIIDGVAIQPVNGVIMQGAGPAYETFLGCFDLARISAAADFVAASSTIKALVLYTDSPGGYTQGMSAAIKALTDLRAARPDLATHAFADNAHSCAYWLASAMGTIHASPAASLGSIGTYAVTQDWSGAAAMAGVKVRLHTTEALKGMGTFGVEWSTEWLAWIDARVAALSAEFKGFVSAQRPGITADTMQGQPFDAPYPPGLVDSTAHKSLQSLVASLV